VKTCPLSQYVPPADGELDAVQEALLRALVPMLVEEIREELVAEQSERVGESRGGASLDCAREQSRESTNGAVLLPMRPR